MKNRILFILAALPLLLSAASPIPPTGEAILDTSFFEGTMPCSAAGSALGKDTARREASPPGSPSQVHGIATKAWSLKAVKVRGPSGTLSFAERPHSQSWLGNGSQVCVDKPDNQLDINVFRYSHNQKFNYLFVDGHVKSYAPAATVSQFGGAYTGKPNGM